jgi:hypothetical protein
MNEVQDKTAPSRHYTASELRKMPREDRRRILEQQAILAEEIYRTHPELTEIAELANELYDYSDFTDESRDLAD